MEKKYDEIQIQELEIYAHHGVFPEETKLGQRFLVCLVLYTSTRKAGRADDLELSIDYGEVSHFVTEYFQSHTYRLLEAAAENLARELLLRYSLLEGLTLEIQKPWAPVGLPLKTVSVKITRFWHTAYLGLGSNLGDKKAYLEQGIQALREDRDCRVLQVSSFLETEPYGGVEQDRFLNACLSLKTLLRPEELLELLHKIEHQAHRERLIHWGPRTLDLDILLYDDWVIQQQDLQIPHPDMQNRDFVLKPLCEIAPAKIHPLLGKSIWKLKEELT